MAEENQYDVFLSHNSQDKPAVERLARRLTDEASLRPFLDKWHLVPGEPWQEALEEALDRSRTCAVFVGPRGISPWEHEEMRAAIEQRVTDRAFRVIPVLLPGAERGERGRLPAFLTRATWVEFRESLDDADAFHHLVAGIKGIPPGRGPGEAVYEGVCPYRGLQVFEEEHAPFFFGRQAATEWLVNDLRGSRFLAAVGPSGSGKSSLVRAGLVPALRRGDLPGSDTWPLCVFRPGHRPLESLTVALIQVTGQTEDPMASLRLMDALAADQRQLHLTTRLALTDAPADRTIVLVVDQFEEIFTLCRDEGQRRPFIDNLLYASAIKGGRTVVVLTMRADFYGKCAAYPDLAARITDHQMLVSPMVEEELRQAIKRPAQLVGLEFEGGLVEALLRDVQAEPGALPLLQHTLLELWERREGHRLTFAAYREIGGIQGAIAHRAESIYAGFDAAQQAIARRVMLRLTQPGEGTEDTRRRAQKSELLPTGEQAEATEAVIQALADARLVTTARDTATGEEQVDVSHEALIRGWPRLRGWIDEDRAGLRTHRRLTEAAREWEENKRKESYLYRGAWLATAEEWAETHADDMNLLERKFLSSSASARKRAQMQRVAIGLAAILLVIGALTLFAIFQNRAAVRESNIAATAQAEADARATAVVVADAERDAARSAEATAQAEADARAVAEAKAVVERDVAQAAQADADRQRGIAQSRALAAYAKRIVDQDSQLAMLLGLEAVYQTYQNAPSTMTAEACEALHHAIVCSRWQATLHSGHASPVNHVAWNPDGTRIVTASLDGTAKVWNAQTSKELFTLSGHTGLVHHVSWNSDGTRIVTASADGSAKVWDAQTGKELFTLSRHTDAILHAAWSSDDTRIITASYDGSAKVWDAQTGKELFTLSGHTRGGEYVAWNPDDTRIVTASADGSAKVWDAQTGKELFTLSGHTDAVLHAAWNSDNTRIVTASSDSTAKVWDPQTGKKFFTLSGHNGPVYHAAWNSDGTRIVTAGYDGSAKVWDAQTGKELFTLSGHNGSVLQTAWNPGGTRIVTASFDGTAKVWDAQTGKELFTLSGHMGLVYHASWNSDGTRIVTASADGSAKVWHAQNVALFTSNGHNGSVNHAAWNSDDTRIVTASADGSAKVWDAQTGKELFALSGHNRPVYYTAWNSDDTRIVTASSDNTAKVWDPQTGKDLFTLRGHTDAVLHAAWNSDNTRIVTASSDNTAKVWDARIGKELFTLSGHREPVNHAAWNSDGTRIVTASSDNTAKVWDARIGREFFTLSGHTKWVEHVAWNADGTRIVTASADGSAKVWDAQTGKELFTLSGHTATVTHAAWSSDDTRIVTAGRDGRVKVWDAQRGAELFTLSEHTATVTHAVWSSDDTRIVTASEDGSVRIYFARIEDLIQFACTRTGRNMTHDEWRRYMGDEPYRLTCPSLPPGD